jgi:hypothetical protein
MWVPSLFLFFFLLGQNGLQHVAWLGDMREVDFWGYRLGRTRRCSASVAGCTRATLKLRANLIRLVRLQRTGVRLAGAKAEFRQYVKNLPALDFHLSREIVDPNLTHPPLFNICFQSTQSLIATPWQWRFLKLP